MVRKRCIRCRKHVRDDGTCQNPNCVLYVPESVEPETPTQETPSTGEPAQSEGESATNTETEPTP